jgi:hypothetical protein
MPLRLSGIMIHPICKEKQRLLLRINTLYYTASVQLAITIQMALLTAVEWQFLIMVPTGELSFLSNSVAIYKNQVDNNGNGTILLWRWR